MDRNDVGMLKAGGQLDLTAKALGAYPENELGRQDLNDHTSRKTGFGREKDPAHASSTELALEGVGRTKRCLEFIAQAGGHREPLKEISQDTARPGA